MTVAEFLDWPGDGSGRKFQLVDGEPRAMSPGSATHGLVQANLAAVIGKHVRAGGYYVGIRPAVETRVRADINLRVPDLGVTCAPNEIGQRTFPDPILLIEVLSPGNAADTWDNVWAYATVPTVKEILVVSSTEVRAELLNRGADGSWPADPEPLGRGDVLHLEAIALDCPLGEVYADTHLLR
jgi:Uma2 family endonuclease